MDFNFLVFIYAMCNVADIDIIIIYIIGVT